MLQSISQHTKNSPSTPTSAAENLATESGISTITRESRSLRGRLGDGDAPSPAMKVAMDRMAVYKAAAAIHRSPAFVMDLINHGLLRAFRTGGPVNRPWLAVSLSELLAMVDRETLYVPPAMVGRGMPRPRVEKTALHPLAAAI
jgi:hypothetical protein